MVPMLCICMSVRMCFITQSKHTIATIATYNITNHHIIYVWCWAYSHEYVIYLYVYVMSINIFAIIIGCVRRKCRPMAVKCGCDLWVLTFIFVLGIHRMVDWGSKIQLIMVAAGQLENYSFLLLLPIEWWEHIYTRTCVPTDALTCSNTFDPSTRHRLILYPELKCVSNNKQQNGMLQKHFWIAIYII